MNHTKVLFVGDNPSSKNLDPNIAFLGTKSHKTLMTWIKELNIINYEMINSNKNSHLQRIWEMEQSGYILIALGNNAAKRLSKLKFNHFKLPHPSPRNRKLNDKEFIRGELLKCKHYLTVLG